MKRHLEIEGQQIFAINTSKVEKRHPAVTRRNTSALPKQGKEWKPVQVGTPVTLEKSLWIQLHTPGVEATIFDPSSPDQPKEVIFPRSAFREPAVATKQPPQPVLGPEVSIAKTRVHKEPKKPRVEKPIEPGEGIDLEFDSETRLLIHRPRRKRPGESAAKRKKFLDKTADWKTLGKSLLRVKIKDTHTDAHWYRAQVLSLSLEDLGRIGRDKKTPLSPNQLVFISKDRYINALRAKNAAKTA
jgi:hypothetical protein